MKRIEGELILHSSVWRTVRVDSSHSRGDSGTVESTRSIVESTRATVESTRDRASYTGSCPDVPESTRTKAESTRARGNHTDEFFFWCFVGVSTAMII